VAEIDTPRTESAIYNLIANAIDASTESADRDVQIRVVHRGNAIVVEVEDHGPGLLAPDLPIFEPFFTTKQGGTGLGLAIVQRAVADLGGRVTYHRHGRATVFALELPIVSGTAN
jgi:C4-dicarboxylate-specific signal transduction histidine kinase